VHAAPTGLAVEVSDDGVGPAGSRRSGIANLRNRAEHRRGTLLLNEPPPARGTRLVWSVPFG
jgi:signal transduction histidine kinase